MRVLLANEARAGAGGVETYLSALAEALVQRGHRVALLYANPALESGPTGIDAAESWSAADLGLSGALKRALDWNPDVAFSHNMRRLDLDEALAASVPLVKMMHGYFGTCVSGQKAHLFPRAQVCTRICGTACLGLYVPRRCGQLAPVEMIANYRWASRQRALFDRYRAIVVASRHMRDEYLSHGVAPARVHAIPLFSADGAPALPGEKNLDAVFLGRLTTLKGPGILLDAAAIAAKTLRRRLSIAIAGEGPERAALERASSRAGEIRVELPGWVGANARRDLLSRARLLAVPSVWPEPFGLVGLEAAAMGVPAVAFDVGGIREWLTDGVNGVLVRPAGDASALGAAIRRLLERPAELSRLARGARDAATRLDVSAHLGRLETVLREARQA